MYAVDLGGEAVEHAQVNLDVETEKLEAEVEIHVG